MQVGAECGRSLAAAIASGACVDEHLADQLIIFCALARGNSRILAPAPLSLHARTAIAVAQQMTAAVFRVMEEPGAAAEGVVVRPGTCLVCCTGAGVAAGGGAKYVGGLN